MDELEKFFKRFSRDFAMFDGEEIAERYLAPYVAVSSKGEIKKLSTVGEIARYFQEYLNEYRSRGVVSCAFEDFEYIKIGECTYVAIVTWLLKDKQGKCLLSWRESYNLVSQSNVLKIYSSADFE